jgi:hypothetical protein
LTPFFANVSYSALSCGVQTPFMSRTTTRSGECPCTTTSKQAAVHPLILCKHKLLMLVAHSSQLTATQQLSSHVFGGTEMTGCCSRCSHCLACKSGPTGLPSSRKDTSTGGEQSNKPP